MQKEGELGFGNWIVLATQCQEAELDAAVDSREHPLSILKIEQADEPFPANDVLEIPFGGVVRSDPARHDQARAPSWIEELEKCLCKYSVGVEIALAGQGEPPSGTGELALRLGFPLRVQELPVQAFFYRRRIATIQLPD